MALLTDGTDRKIGTAHYVAAFAVFFTAIALYYFNWRTQTIYGDDLSCFDTYNRMSNTQIITLSNKYRPVNNIAIRILILLFGKHVAGLYYFNVAIQALCATVFMRIAYQLLGSKWLSALCGLWVAISRFNLYNITQLYNGGGLESLAMVFFLYSLFYVLRSFEVDAAPLKRRNILLTSLTFANLAMYTHERYMVILPFIFLSLLFQPAEKMKNRDRIYIGGLAILSALINYSIKRYLYHITFFMGTGNTSISFSLSSALNYFRDGVMDIIMFNSGPDYLAGLSFTLLPPHYMIVVRACLVITALVLVAYTAVVLRNAIVKKRNATQAHVMLLFAALFILCLLPAVVTIRLELRWLQASFAIYCLMLILAVKHVFPNRAIRSVYLAAFILISLVIETKYLEEGAGSIYFVKADRRATNLRTAIEKGALNATTDTLCFIEETRNVNNEDEIKWILQDGYFFSFYNAGRKNIIFSDSSGKSSHSHNTQLVIFNDTSASVAR